MKVHLKRFDRGCGNHTVILDEPYYSALANIDGLARATNNATFRGVNFGRAKQRELVVYFEAPKNFSYEDADWKQKSAAQVKALESGCLMEVADEILAGILAASAKIDAVVANAQPALPTYPCACVGDGCAARVRVKGDYCPSCHHDEIDT